MDYKIYTEKKKTVLKINILPDKVCTYDCIFCPLRRGKKSNEVQNFNNFDEIIKELENIITKNAIDLIFINSKGETLLHNKIKDIIQFIKSRDIKIRLLSNGYILNEFKEIANLCDEVIGEIKAIKEADFKKFQRPIEEYTIAGLIKNMVEFKKQYLGTFILNITILNTINNDKNSLDEIKTAINKINPDEVVIEKEEDEIFVKKYGICEQELKIIKNKLL